MKNLSQTFDAEILNNCLLCSFQYHIFFYIILAHRIRNAWFIEDHHRLSTILHPKLKNFNFCIHERKKSIVVLKREFEKLKLNDSSHSNIINITPVNINNLSTTAVSIKRKYKNLLSQCLDVQ